jgi:para-nitrobenzyl esterase
VALRDKCPLLVTLLWTLTAVAGIEEPIRVEGGLVSGTPSWGHGVRMYRGIPFAAPPAGDLRWRPPQPPRPWDGVLAAEHFAPACMQRRRPLLEASWASGVNGYSEDCLYLNIWTPAASGDDALPVMVWIYGGGGVEGSGGEALYDGNGLAKKGVVVVTFNYRVNVFGWFAHPELTRESPEHASGNYGALDQIAALRWVQNNIARFGGDPKRVTIFGESGGSRSVNWLMASPLAKGLFQRAIGESHTVFGRMQSLADAHARGETFARGAGAGSLTELRAMPADDLLSAFLADSEGFRSAIVDGWFLPEDIYSIFAAGRQNDVALITGATNDEAGRPRRRGGAPHTRSEYESWVRSAFGDFAERTLAAYPAEGDADVRRAYHDLTRDTNFAGHRTWAKLQSETGSAPAWLYLFSHSVPAYSSTGGVVRRGAPHGAEISFVFDNLRQADRPWSAVDHAVADTVSSYWVNFARSGDPNGPGLPRWPPYDAQTEETVDIGSTVRAATFNRAGVDVLAQREAAARRGGEGEP